MKKDDLITNYLTCLRLHSILLYLEEQGQLTAQQRQKAFSIATRLCQVDADLF